MKSEIIEVNPGDSSTYSFMIGYDQCSESVYISSVCRPSGNVIIGHEYKSAEIDTFISRYPGIEKQGKETYRQFITDNGVESDRSITTLQDSLSCEEALTIICSLIQAYKFMQRCKKMYTLAEVAKALGYASPDVVRTLCSRFNLGTNIKSKKYLTYDEVTLLYMTKHK